ncbi:MAG: sugar phosphate nucleotidyltransferase [Patescibacteria group bacterium]|nr:sugar phosphate nucleotidyltransferase [Patescibacteria group bacterium]
MKAIILAGGGGTRLWPASRNKFPKQLRPVIGDRSMLRVTYDRLRRGFAPKDILVVTGAAMLGPARRDLPGLPARNLIADPYRKDSSNALAFALLHLFAREPDESFVMINSDAYVKNEREYIRMLKAVEKTIEANPNKMIFVGIPPRYPETGYGYIKMGAPAGSADREGRYSIRQFIRFVEKPDFKTAESYLASGDYLWNPSLFAGTVRHFLKEFKIHMPEHYAIYEKILPLIDRPGTANKIAALYEQLVSISIDFGLMEHMKEGLVLPATFDWMDIGHWRAVAEATESQSQVKTDGPIVNIDSVGNLVRQPKGKIVALIGVNDMVVVDTGDALLVCPKGRAQDVRRVVAEMKKDPRMKKYL